VVFLALGLVAFMLPLAVREWAKATAWGLPAWPRTGADRPLVCETCGRAFPFVNQEALPPGREALSADGLLVLHTRAQHQELPGPLYGTLPKTKRKTCKILRPPAEVWHQQRNHRVSRLRKARG
jgi:hypothetical protein